VIPHPRLSLTVTVQVNTNCWTTTASVASWLQEHNLTADGGYEYFVNRVQVGLLGRPNM
jgi:hypothetical protein